MGLLIYLNCLHKKSKDFMILHVYLLLLNVQYKFNISYSQVKSTV